jgi:hypothetical protein
MGSDHRLIDSLQVLAIIIREPNAIQAIVPPVVTDPKGSALVAGPIWLIAGHFDNPHK